MGDAISIERELYLFLSGLLERLRPDLLVCAERKATAIMRALIERVAEPRIAWDWHNVLSTSAIDHFNWSAFTGRRVLLFDELVHHGVTLKKHADALASVVPAGTEIVTAGYAVWDRCEHPPHYAYHGAVDADTYESIRDDMVSMLQEHGSLLLDTEHVELSIRLQCGIRDFYDELARAAAGGNAYSFISGAARTNLTIDHPDLLSESAITRYLIPGSNTEGSVCKIRVLEKTHEQFSLLPIFYPNTRCVPVKEWIDALPGFVEKDHLEKATPSEYFYIVGLLGAIELLRGVVAALSDLTREQKIILEVPRSNFRHLKVMFPRVNVDELHEYVSGIVNESERLRPKRGRQSVRNLGEEQLFELSRRVIYKLVREAGTSHQGKSWKQMMQLTAVENQKVGLDPRALTVVTDRLIDSGLVVTGTRSTRNMEGEHLIVRTFAPEGEVMSAKIRQQLMVRGSQCLSVS
jgi:hypothetical protein